MAVVVVMVTGLLSRSAPFVELLPAEVGDALYASMVYFGLRFLAPHWHFLKSAALALSFCFAIECSQLFSTHFLDQIRQTLPGRLILGQGFLWEDLLAYTMGVAIMAMLDVRWQKMLLHKKSQ
jgi:hypothetical protein